MPTYIALIHGDPGSYGIAIPDLPGCTSGGDTPEEALQRIRDAASDWVESEMEVGTPIPPPRPLEALKADPEIGGDFEDVVAIGLVEVEVPGRVVRLNITLDEALATRIDRAAAAAGETRSGWLAQAARARLGGQPKSHRGSARRVRAP